MSSYAFEPGPRPSLSIAGTDARFPVHRIYCVGRNYAEHAREMGSDPTREPPFFFQKPADALIESGAVVPYPSRTADFHHEVELVIALSSGGKDLLTSNALDCVFGYAVGNDFTRRDLQKAAKNAGQPWDTSKGFDNAAGIAPIHRAVADQLPAGRIWLSVNGALRQQGQLHELIWSVPEIIAELSGYFTLRAGDLIYTGTPAGVGPLQRGDHIECGIDGLGTLQQRVGSGAL